MFEIRSLTTSEISFSHLKFQNRHTYIHTYIIVALFKFEYDKTYECDSLGGILAFFEIGDGNSVSSAQINVYKLFSK